MVSHGLVTPVILKGLKEEKTRSEVVPLSCPVALLVMWCAGARGKAPSKLKNGFVAICVQQTVHMMYDLLSVTALLKRLLISTTC